MTLLLEVPNLILNIELKYCNFAKSSAVVGEENRNLDKLGTTCAFIFEIRRFQTKRAVSDIHTHVHLSRMLSRFNICFNIRISQLHIWTYTMSSVRILCKKKQLISPSIYRKNRQLTN